MPEAQAAAAPEAQEEAAPQPYKVTVRGQGAVKGVEDEKPEPGLFFRFKIKGTNETAPQPAAVALKQPPAGIALHVKVHDPDGNPIVTRLYTIEMDGQTIEGCTTADGVVQAQLPKGATEAKLVVKAKNGPVEFKLQLGKVDKPDTPRGAQQRLASLGYAVTLSGELDDQTKRALANFQHDHGLTGAADLAALARPIDDAYLGK